MITLLNHSKYGFLFLFLALLYQPVISCAQNDSLPAVLTIIPESGSTRAPQFSLFCKDRCWLGKQEFDLAERRFVPKDSISSCLPAFARELDWMADPFDTDYFWRYDYQRDSQYQADSLIVWRYDRSTTRLDSFVSLLRGVMAVGKPGIWVTNHQELVLLDRRTMQVLNRMGNPADGQLMYLRPWGDDVLVTNQWLFHRKTNRYVPFFPLPTDLQDCKSPADIEFVGSACSSMVREDGPPSCYLTVPDQRPVKLSFGWRYYPRPCILAVNLPLVWFDFPGKVAAVDVTNGDSLVYAGPTEERLPGDQDGRFLGFQSERGLSFFDKYTCQFRVINKPYGFEAPRFTSDYRYIYLTYKDHWEIVHFSGLDTSFSRSSVREEYQAFEQEQAALRKNLPEDFYPQYQAYLKLYHRYGNSNNAKITEAWNNAKSGLKYGLYFAADTLMERIAGDYAAGRFDPSVSSEIAEGLFAYWGHTGALQPALQLLQVPENKEHIENNMQSGGWLIDILKNTKHRLDSVQQIKQSPDERLYALGKVWLDYCFNKVGFRYNSDPRRNFEQAYTYFRSLIRQYPNSLWADNAAYDTLYYIDYQPCCTDDETPPGNDSEAYKVFTQFLNDYPTSDRRPDVLLRLANAIQRGVHNERFHRVSEEHAAEYLQIIEAEYPEFARTSEEYRKSIGWLNARAWSGRWEMFVAVNQPVYRISDTIRVNVRIRNKSRTDQTLDTGFLSRWQERLALNLHPVREKGCEELWGDFLLLRENEPVGVEPITLPPGGYYEETFVLSHTSVTKNGYPGKFDLTGSLTYLYYLEYHHPELTWLWMQARTGGSFRIE